MDQERKYAFNWELLGNIAVGRPHLGPSTRIEMSRLMQFCFRDILEQKYGTAAADGLFREAGYLAGREFSRHVLGDIRDFDEFARTLQRVLKEMGIGILRMEKVDLEQGDLVLTISEDLDCSGLPDTGAQVCTFDEGFISALLESFSGKKFVVREIDCWCSGDRTCRFTARAAA